MVDYCSLYIEEEKLENLTSKAVINHMKFIFAHHGILFSERMIDFKYIKFANHYNFSIITYSPKHAKSNEHIQSIVKILKSHYLKAEKDNT